jgi:hypothetical protein
MSIRSGVSACGVRRAGRQRAPFPEGKVKCRDMHWRAVDLVPGARPRVPAAAIGRVSKESIAMNTTANTTNTQANIDATAIGCNCSDCRCVECRCGANSACQCPRKPQAD